MKKVNVAVVGASGYMGEEVVRLLLRHPQVNLTRITSRTYAGQRIGQVFPRYYEADLCFSNPDVEDIAANASIAFLALPHGTAAEYALPLVEKGVKVIDVSADFRLDDPDVYEEYYGLPHPCPEWLPKAVYGLAERNRDAIRGADIIACPGCYPTSILLPLTALMHAGLVRPDGIVVSSMSGVTGAGRKADVALLFAECNESLRPYKVTMHRHISEIEQELTKAASEKVVLNFIPHLVPVNRGIHTTILANAAITVSFDMEHVAPPRTTDLPAKKQVGSAE